MPHVVRKIKRAKARRQSLRRTTADLGVSTATVRGVLKEAG